MVADTVDILEPACIPGTRGGVAPVVSGREGRQDALPGRGLACPGVFLS